ncbi:hypothetical protein I7I48_02306 [Histoplasma ohiense]|nr:hypothetical protein I7I48_02306 [Histoplasma ohiense (nom. inval.)]
MKIIQKHSWGAKFTIAWYLSKSNHVVKFNPTIYDQQPSACY